MQSEVGGIKPLHVLIKSRQHAATDSKHKCPSPALRQTQRPKRVHGACHLVLRRRLSSIFLFKDLLLMMLSNIPSASMRVAADTPYARKSLRAPFLFLSREKSGSQSLMGSALRPCFPKRGGKPWARHASPSPPPPPAALVVQPRLQGLGLLHRLPGPRRRLLPRAASFASGGVGTFGPRLCQQRNGLWWEGDSLGEQRVNECLAARTAFSLVHSCACAKDCLDS